MSAIDYPTIQRVTDDAQRRGLHVIVRVMGTPDRSVEAAARSCGCDVAQIARSLVLKERPGNLALVLVSGANMDDPRALAERLGRTFLPADPEEVRRLMGFEMGSAAPLGHLIPVPVLMDVSLLDHDVIWCTAGRSDALLRVDPKALQSAIGADIIHVRAPQ